MWSIDKLQRAWQLASKLHKGQKYGSHEKGQQTEYLNQIGSVTFEILAAIQEEKDMNAGLAIHCAILHDTIEDTPQQLIDLQLLKSLQIRNGNIIIIGNTGGNDNSVIETAEQYPNLITLKFGEASISTNTDEIFFNHPLDLTPSHIIGGFYLKNTIPFSLTGNPF